jgi:hypothetical protein
MSEDVLEPMPTLNEDQVTKIKGLKIPVDSSHPGTYWIASIQYGSAMPTDNELRMIQSLIEFEILSRYNKTYQEKILAKPLPAEGGHVTKIFRKGSMWIKQSPLYEKNGEVTREPSEGARLINGGDPHEGWTYRRSTWDSGHWPQWPAPRRSLIEVMDHIYDLGGQVWSAWTQWKADRPDIFGVTNG